MITPHAHEAAWLLRRVDEAFEPLFTDTIRHDFYERIADAVEEHLSFIPGNQNSAENLLKVILRECRDVLGEMEAGDFPSSYHE